MILYLIVCLILIVFLIKWKQSYWKRRGLYQLNHEFFLGHLRKVVGSSHYSVAFNDMYKEIKSNNQIHGGIYALLSPIYIPIDPDILKKIFVKDFASFMGHGVYHHPKDVLSMNLFYIDGDIWKQLRAKLTPTFTSGKMKMMFEILLNKTEGLDKLVGRHSDNRMTANIKDILGRFTTDIIGSCAFGIECNSLENPHDQFRIQGKNALKPEALASILKEVFPWSLLASLGFRCHGKETEDFYTNIVKETIHMRENNKINRKDFLQLLLQMKNNSSQQPSIAKDTWKLTENEIVAQCFVFFLAGFETSSTTMTFALLELSQNQEIQQKLRKEIQKTLKDSDGKITYDGVISMKYLDKVVNETLRKFPPVSAIPRVCTKDYRIPGTDVVIEKGTRVQIPVWGLHKDPEYYPDPEVFNPENFSEENKAKRPDFTFLPFGEGPRMCIGLRFGMMQTKLGLISLLRKFNFTLNKKTPFPLEMEKASVVLSVKGDVWLDVTRI